MNWRFKAHLQNLLSVNRFMYQNGMRAFEYRLFFNDVLFQLLIIEEETDAASLRILSRENIKLNARFYGRCTEALE